MADAPSETLLHYAAFMTAGNSEFPSFLPGEDPDLSNQDGHDDGPVTYWGSDLGWGKILIHTYINAENDLKWAPCLCTE